MLKKKKKNVLIKTIRHSFRLIVLCLISACQEQIFTESVHGDIATIQLEFSGVKDEMNGEPVATRAVMPSDITGYLFQEGLCTRILSTEDLHYDAEQKQIRTKIEGGGIQTLYLVASKDTLSNIPGVAVGMKLAEFLNLKTGADRTFTGKVELNPSNSLRNQSIVLESTHAEMKVSRASTFQIESIEVRGVSSKSYYFARNPFETVADTITRIYNSSNLQVTDLDITLPIISESKNVTVTIYGTVYETKASLDFNFNQLKRNNLYTIKAESPGIDPTNRKLMVIAIAGQSNATGYDESGVDLNGMDAPSPHAYQLGMQTSMDRDDRNNLKLLPMDFCPQDMYDMRTRFRTKKLHLPLSKELLKRIPAGYEVVVIEATRPSSCVTYEGCNAFGDGAFTTSKHNYGLGFYDNKKMLPTLLNTIYYWNKDGAYYKMLRDRIKYILDMNPENKLLGIVWCQGENDADPGWGRKHYENFDSMTKSFFQELNDAGYGNRCPRGTAGKHIWYNFTTTRHYLAFHADGPQGIGQGIFGGYKLWNPDTFVRPSSIPENTNQTNGDGRTNTRLASHYGNGAFSRVVAPMIVECMDRNGGLFNGKTPQNNQYIYQVSQEEARSRGGNITDSDIQENLLVALPFDEPNNVLKNLAQNQTGVQLQNNGLKVSSSQFTLPAINGKRDRATLKLKHETWKNISVSLTEHSITQGWSASCLIRRTGHEGEGEQSILTSLSKTQSPYMAYRTTYKKENCGPYTEFMASPNWNGLRNCLLMGSLHNADRVRTYNEWIHYGVTFDANTHIFRIFMNGEEVDQYQFTNLNSPSLEKRLYIGGTRDTKGMEGEMADFFFWNQAITEDVMYKVYLRSFWGYEN